MSERKVLQKYYPANFDYRELTRRRGPKQEGPKVQTVRLMAPFSMRCTSCGEFIYKGRKFNSRKETPLDNKFLNIQIFYFYIKCTRCSSQITFRTDPKNADYAMVSGAVRNMEPWRNKAAEEESVEERLDRLEREEAEEAGEDERNPMADLEAKNEDAKREMEAADALDEIRQRNARIHISEKNGMDYADAVVRSEDEERSRQELEDDAAAKRAFAAKRSENNATGEGRESPPHAVTIPKPGSDEALMPPPPVPVAAEGEVVMTVVEGNVPEKVPSFKRAIKKKKDHAAMLGIRKKPALV